MNNNAPYLNEEYDANDNIDEIHSMRIREFMNSLTENNNFQRPNAQLVRLTHQIVRIIQVY